MTSLPARLRTLLALLFALGGCGGEAGSSGGGAGRGVDLDARVLRVGLLADLSGPAASICRPIQLEYEVCSSPWACAASGCV